MSSIEESVIQKISTRANVGKVKYGVTMDREDLTELEWLAHAQEEAMDLAIYLEKLIQIKKDSCYVDTN
jgi:hypothetical protein